MVSIFLKNWGEKNNRLIWLATFKIFTMWPFTGSLLTALSLIKNIKEEIGFCFFSYKINAYLRNHSGEHFGDHKVCPKALLHFTVEENTMPTSQIWRWRQVVLKFPG